MKRLAVIAVILAGVAGARCATGAERAYDVLKAQYAPYTAAGDPLGFPMKVWALSGEQLRFWRGSRDLYFAWCKVHARDWLEDRGSYLLNHGDLHPGNIGKYAAEGRLGQTAAGMVDFDDTARLPFQIELLQGLISLRLVARENGIPLGGRREELARGVYDAYREAVASREPVRRLVAAEGRLTKLLEAADDQSYEATLERFTVGGKFRVTVHSKKGKVKEILRPAMDRADDLARGLAQVIENAPSAKGAFRYRDVETIRRSIKDAALRTRLESVGSQGLKKYLVLLEKPFRGLEMDVVMYVKQEVPSAAERAGVIPRDPRTPGRRCSEDMDRLINPPAYLNSWCEMGGESFWVTFKEPWSEEIDATEVKDFKTLLELARFWGKVAGGIHRENGDARAILERLDRPDLFDRLRHRSTLYLAELDRQYADFMADERVRAEALVAQRVVDGVKGEAGARAAMRE